MKKTIWQTPTDHIVIVSEIDAAGLYYYEYDMDEFLMREESPKQFGLSYIGVL